VAPSSVTKLVVFFQALYEGLPQSNNPPGRNYNAVNGSIPSLAERTGDFSELFCLNVAQRVFDSTNLVFAIEWTPI